MTSKTTHKARHKLAEYIYIYQYPRRAKKNREETNYFELPNGELVIHFWCRYVFIILLLRLAVWWWFLLSWQGQTNKKRIIPKLLLLFDYSQVSTASRSFASVSVLIVIVRRPNMLCTIFFFSFLLWLPEKSWCNNNSHYAIAYYLILFWFYVVRGYGQDWTTVHVHS